MPTAKVQVEDEAAKMSLLMDEMLFSTDFDEQPTVLPSQKAKADALRDYQREEFLAEGAIKERYSSVSLTKDFLRKSIAYLSYYSFHGTEYFKIFSQLKAKSDEEIIMEEVQTLSFVWAQGFDDQLDEEKNWDLLDSCVHREFPDFTPPTISVAKRFAATEGRCDKLATSLTEVSSKMEKKGAIAIWVMTKVG